MKEKPKRLTPLKPTLRELFLKSGNLCAFPNCAALMMNRNGDFIGQICHIEAADAGGPRFNETMSNEDRRAVSNLLLMCYEHHCITNDVNEYPVVKLQKFKQQHEKLFAHPDRAMLDKFVDKTTVGQPVAVNILRELNKLLKWNLPDSELECCVNELNDHIEIFKRVPLSARLFYGAIAKRIYLMQDTLAVREEPHGCYLLLSDFSAAHDVSDQKIKEFLIQLDFYGLGGFDEILIDFGKEPAIRLRTLDSGWPLWINIAQFSSENNIPIERFVVDLDFSSLDE